MCVPICNRVHAKRANSVKITSFRGVGLLLFNARVLGEPPYLKARNFVTINYILWHSPRWKFRDFSLHRFDTIQQCAGETNRQTDRRTGRRPGHG